MAAERRPRSDWERMVREHEGSGLSLREFAAEHGVNPHTLSWWRWRTRSERTAPMQFVPVVVASSECEPAELDVGPIVAELPNGVTLRFEHRLDGVGLRELVAAFGSRS